MEVEKESLGAMEFREGGGLAFGVGVDFVTGRVSRLWRVYGVQCAKRDPTGLGVYALGHLMPGAGSRYLGADCT